MQPLSLLVRIQDLFMTKIVPDQETAAFKAVLGRLAQKKRLAGRRVVVGIFQQDIEILRVHQFGGGHGRHSGIASVDQREEIRIPGELIHLRTEFFVGGDNVVVAGSLLQVPLGDDPLKLCRFACGGKLALGGRLIAGSKDAAACAARPDGFVRIPEGFGQHGVAAFFCQIIIHDVLRFLQGDGLRGKSRIVGPFTHGGHEGIGLLQVVLFGLSPRTFVRLRRRILQLLPGLIGPDGRRRSDEGLYGGRDLCGILRDRIQDLVGSGPVHGSPVDGGPEVDCKRRVAGDQIVDLPDAFLFGHRLHVVSVRRAAGDDKHRGSIQELRFLFARQRDAGLCSVYGLRQLLRAFLTDLLITELRQSVDLGRQMIFVRLILRLGAHLLDLHGVEILRLHEGVHGIDRRLPVFGDAIEQSRVAGAGGQLGVALTESVVVSRRIQPVRRCQHHFTVSHAAEKVHGDDRTADLCGRITQHGRVHADGIVFGTQRARLCFRSDDCPRHLIQTSVDRSALYKIIVQRADIARGGADHAVHSQIFVAQAHARDLLLQCFLTDRHVHAAVLTLEVAKGDHRREAGPVFIGKLSGLLAVSGADGVRQRVHGGLVFGKHSVIARGGHVLEGLLDPGGVSQVRFDRVHESGLILADVIFGGFDL